MSVNVYCGLQGSGKSFEVVSSVILDAVANGRRVVTNVAGINEEKIHEYLVVKRDSDPEKLGQISHVSNERISEPFFFPDEEKPQIEAFVRGGDLVAIDEAWRFWGTDNGKLSHEHMQFFRMHRHYVHPLTFVACDLVLMTQDISGLHRSVKNVVEYTFRMQKHKSLGFTKRYRVDIHEGYKINSKTRIDTRQKAYDVQIFPLYQSYAGGAGKEAAIDKRQNIFGNKTLWIYVAGFAVLMTISTVSVWRFFHRANPQTSAAKLPVTPAVSPGASVSSAPEKPAFSEQWRIVGTYQALGQSWVVVSDISGRLRVESPSVFSSGSASAVGDIDGERVTRWSGAIVKPVVATEVLK
jgi:zona occludens toxin